MEAHRLKGSHGPQQALFDSHVRQTHQMYPDSAVDFHLDDNRHSIYPYAFRSNNINQHKPLISIFADDAASNCNK